MGSQHLAERLPCEKCLHGSRLGGPEKPAWWEAGRNMSQGAHLHVKRGQAASRGSACVQLFSADDV